MTEIAIVGAGPAGSAAAITLAKKGYNVTIYEKEKIPRNKSCGGGVAIRCLKSLYELDIDINEVSQQNYNGFSLSYKNISAQTDLKRTIGWGVYRDDFDSHLTRSAICSGAKLRNLKIDGFKEENGKIIISTDCGRKEVDVLLGADGIRSVIRKNLNFSYNRNKLGYCILAEIKVESNKIDEFNNLLKLDFSYLRKGFSWAFPKINGNTINVGMGGYLNSINNHKIEIKELFLQFIKSLGLSVKPNNIEGALLPFGGTVECFGRNNVLLLGDAAGLVSPLTGEGIPYALESGIIAADCIEKYYDKNIPLVDLYTNNLEQISLEINKYALILQRKLFGSKFYRKKIIQMCAKNDYLIEIISKIFMHIISYEEGIKKLSKIKILTSSLHI